MINLVSRERPKEIVTADSIIYPATNVLMKLCGSDATTYNVVPYSIPVYRLEEYINDQVLDLSSLSYEERYAFVRSDSYKAFKKAFKNVEHVRKEMTLDFTGAVLVYKDDSNYPCEDGSGLNQFHREYVGMPFVASGYVYYYGIAPTDPLTQLYQRQEYLDFMSTDSIFEANLVEKLSRDETLIGTKSFSLANFLWELKEVLTLTAFFKLKTDSFAKEVADRHLAINFGLKPLISDIEAIVDILANLNHRINTWNKAVDNYESYDAHINGFEEMLPVQFTVTGPYSYCKEEVTGFIYKKIIGHTYFKPERISELDSAALHWALSGLDHTLSSIWEGVPYSFLVDWVINIQEMIEAYEDVEPVIRTSASVYGYSTEITIDLTSTFYTARAALPQTTIYTTLPDVTWFEACVTSSTEARFERKAIDPSELPIIEPFNIAEFTWEQTPEHIGLAAALYVSNR